MKDIFLKNSLTKKKEKFIPIKKNKVSFYTCGPTVYSYPHIGNMRTYIINDLLKRTLQFNSYKVKHIMNLTDVGHLTSDSDTGEDKIEKAKKIEHKSAWEIAEFYTNIFKKYSRALNILPPNKYVRATSCVKEQIKLAKLLDKKGYLYKTSDGIYFDTSKLKDYGKLTNQNLEELKTGARIEMAEKKNPTDFAIWKFSPKNEQRDMEWNSPWGITASSLRNKKRSIPNTVIHAINVIPPMWNRKVLKSMPLAEPIIRLGGSPTRVATPPVSDSKAAASRNGMGVTFIARAIRMIRGPKITTVVTLSSSRESTVTAVPSSAINMNCLPLLILAI